MKVTSKNLTNIERAVRSIGDFYTVRDDGRETHYVYYQTGWIITRKYMFAEVVNENGKLLIKGYGRPTAVFALAKELEEYYKETVEVKFLSDKPHRFGCCSYEY